MVNIKGGLTDMFLFIILAFIIVVTSGIFIYVGMITSTELHNKLDNQSTSAVNYTQILNDSMDKVPTSYQVLKWGSAVIIFGMILSIFIGSYLVTTRSIYFVPYIIIVFVAVMFSVVIANAYNDLLSEPTVGAILQTFTASNYFLLYLPFVTAVVGIFGGIIMYASYKLGSQDGYYG